MSSSPKDSLKPLVGILSLQGCVEPHLPHLRSLGLEVRQVRRSEDFKNLNGLIIPGGESTTMLKLLDIFSMKEALARCLETIPIWGVCAGAIVMAKNVMGPEQFSFGAMDVDVERNAYGRQMESFIATVENTEVAFIRAPKISRVGSTCRVRASVDGSPVWIESELHMMTTFHPELSPTVPTLMHRQFFLKVLQNSLDVREESLPQTAILNLSLSV